MNLVLALVGIVGVYSIAYAAFWSTSNWAPHPWPAWKRWLLAVVGAGLVLTCLALYVPSPSVDDGDDCYIEWDGRSNPTVCN